MDLSPESACEHNAAVGLPPRGGSGFKQDFLRKINIIRCLPPRGGSGFKLPKSATKLLINVSLREEGVDLSSSANALYFGSWMSPSARREWI